MDFKSTKMKPTINSVVSFDCQLWDNIEKSFKEINFKYEAPYFDPQSVYIFKITKLYLIRFLKYIISSVVQLQ